MKRAKIKVARQQFLHGKSEYAAPLGLKYGLRVLKSNQLIITL